MYSVNEVDINMYIILMYHFNISLLCNKLDLPSLLVLTWLGLGTVKYLENGLILSCGKI